MAAAHDKHTNSVGIFIITRPPFSAFRFIEHELFTAPDKSVNAAARQPFTGKLKKTAVCGFPNQSRLFFARK
jgi:hypothetical protein